MQFPTLVDQRSDLAVEERGVSLVAQRRGGAADEPGMLVTRLYELVLQRTGPTPLRRIVSPYFSLSVMYGSCRQY